MKDYLDGITRRTKDASLLTQHSRRGFIGLALASVLAACQSPATTQPARVSASTTPQATATPQGIASLHLKAIEPGNASQLKQVAVWDAGGVRVRAVAWSPDAELLAVGADRSLQIWDARSGTKLTTLQGQTGEVSGLAWSRKNHLLTSISRDGSLRVWDTDKWAVQRVMQRTTVNDILLSVAWSPDETRLVTGNAFGSALLWEAATGKNLADLQGQPPANAHGGGGAYPFGVYGVAWSPDGSRIASTRYDDLAHVWDARTNKKLLVLQTSAQPNGVAWSPDGQILVTTSDDGTAQLWDSSGKNIAVLSGHQDEGWAYPVRWSPDGLVLASAHQSGLLEVWEVKTGKGLAALQGHTQAVWSIDWSANDLLIASGSDDGTVRLWGVL
ncbi:MAG TPA: WD40 repeat domain-containing protein [Ktedonosporobacter sp.]|nr:WD40 repeat domain-containing protein [Ktedonosporobacter sp.]